MKGRAPQCARAVGPDPSAGADGYDVTTENQTVDFHFCAAMTMPRGLSFYTPIGLRLPRGKVRKESRVAIIGSSRNGLHQNLFTF